MQLAPKQLVILGVAVVVVLVLVLMGLGIIPGLKVNPTVVQSASLTVWGVEDSDLAMQPAIRAFSSTHPGVTVSYRQFSDSETYHTTLLEALAAGKGPDVFAIRNTEVMRHLPKLVAMPKELLSSAALQNTFAPVVAHDFVINGNVVALPLAVDTLALIYNRDHFNEAGIVSPPTTWDDVITYVPKLVHIDPSQRVVQAALAFGGSAATVPRVEDILSALMLQGGVVPVGPDWGGAYLASRGGYDAVNFYLQFSNTASPAYTWNERMPNASDAFAQGLVSMIVDYASAIPSIRERNPLVNLAVAALPQPSGAQKSKTMASYWGYTVARQSREGRLAWNFVTETATNPNVVTAYLALTKRPPAQPQFIESYRDNPELAAYARQILIADSWPMPNAEATAAIFSELVSTLLENRASLEIAVGRAQGDLSRLIGARPQ